MARPKNKIPTGLLAARVPLELIEDVRREADAAGMRLGEFLTQTLERALEEDDELLDEEGVVEMCVQEGLTEDQIEEVKQDLGFNDKDDAEHEKVAGLARAIASVLEVDGVRRSLGLVLAHLYDILKFYSAENKPGIARLFLNRITDDLQMNQESIQRYAEARARGEPWATG